MSFKEPQPDPDIRKREIIKKVRELEIPNMSYEEYFKKCHDELEATWYMEDDSIKKAIRELQLELDKLSIDMDKLSDKQS